MVTSTSCATTRDGCSGRNSTDEPAAAAPISARICQSYRTPRTWATVKTSVSPHRDIVPPTCTVDRATWPSPALDNR